MEPGVGRWFVISAVVSQPNFTDTNTTQFGAGINVGRGSERSALQQLSQAPGVQNHPGCYVYYVHNPHRVDA